MGLYNPDLHGATIGIIVNIGQSFNFYSICVTMFRVAGYILPRNWLAMFRLRVQFNVHRSDAWIVQCTLTRRCICKDCHHSLLHWHFWQTNTSQPQHRECYNVRCCFAVCRFHRPQVVALIAMWNAQAAGGMMVDVPQTLAGAEKCCDACLASSYNTPSILCPPHRIW